MNIIEKCVYNFVKSNPRLKMRVRDCYQLACDLVPVRRNANAYPVTVHDRCFFGFHDKTPWSAGDRFLLAHRYSAPLRMPRPDDPLEVGYFDQRQGGETFHPVGITKAWNWHQGAQLQWLGEQDKMVYNDFDGKQHVARVANLCGDLEKTIGAPVAAVSPQGTHALSYSFARLRGSPHGYSYANGLDATAGELIPVSTGLSMIDIQTGAISQLFTVADLAAIQTEASMQGSFHYISHCQFSPDGRRFKFFHRWTVDANRQWTRMFSADLDGGRLHLFPTSGMVSHVSWKGNDRLIAYARTVQHGDAYYEFTDLTQEVRIFGGHAFSSDGHPMASRNGEWMITDTYADRFRRRSLVLYHFATGKRYDLGIFYSPKAFAGKSIADHLQCDLHPRWNRENTAVCFDSAHTGVRSLCVMRFGDLTKTEPRSL